MADTTGLSGLAGRYAQALLETADDKKELDQVAADLGNLKRILGESEDLRRMVMSPVFSREQQAAAMSAVVEKVGLGELARRFVLVVAHNRRLFALDAMIDAYLAELARRRGEMTAQVTSARALTEAQQASLGEALRSAMGTKVQVEVEVDPSIIGGLIVRVGSRMIDNSLSSKLQRLQLAMKGVG